VLAVHYQRNPRYRVYLAVAGIIHTKREQDGVAVAHELARLA
jgi:hypothetical protein